MKNFNEYSKDEQDRMKRGNRYSKIHILFRELAKKKAIATPIPAPDIRLASAKIKRFWKDFFSIDSLKELSDQQLKDLERFVGERIKHESKH